MHAGRPTSAAWLLVLAGVAAALLWVFLGESEGRDSTAGTESRESDASNAASIAAAAPPTAEAGAMERTVAADGAGAAEADSNSHLLELQVVNRAGGQGMAGVQGYWMPLAISAGDQALAWERAGTDVESLVLAQGVPFTTGEQGRARCRVPNRPIVVVARAGRLYGESYRPLTSEPDELQLTLYADASLEVFVHAESGGVLAGFPLALLQVQDQWTSALSVTRSDSAGIARFRNLGPELPLDSGGARLMLRAAAPFLEAQEIELNLEAWPEGALDYSVGPFGSLTLHLQEHDGSPRLAATRCVVQIQEGEQGFWRRVEGFQPREGLGVARRTALGGEAHFPFIGLGLDLEAAAWMDASDRPFDIRIRGPEQPGEQVDAVLWVERLRPVVRFRALDGAGQPLREQGIECVARLKGGGYSMRDQSELRTDAEGRTDYIVTVSIGGEAPGSLVLDLSLVRGSAGLRHRMELPEDLQPGVLDLGDVQLLEDPVLASGRVVDAKGIAVPQARLVLAVETESGMMRMIGGAHYADDAGAFLIRGRTEAAELRLHASRGGQLEKVVTIPAGAEGIEIRLDPGYRIAGRLLVDEGILATGLELQIAPDPYPEGEDADVGDWPWPRTRPAADGSFTMLLAESGPATVLVTDRGSWVLLARIDHVLPAGEDGADDPRLAAIDLRGALSRFTLEFVDGRGLPVEEVEMTIPGLLALARGEGLRLYLWGGKKTLFLPVESFAFEAVGTGQRKLSGRVDAPGEHTFRMEAGLPARVRTLPVGSLPRGVRVVLELTPVGAGRTGLLDLWNVVPDAQGEYRLRLPGSGRYRATVGVYLRDSEGFTVNRSFPPAAQAPVFEVRETVAEQVFELLLDARAIEAFVAAED